MALLRSKKTVARFNAIDLHDDELIAIEIEMPRGRTSPGTVVLQMRDDSNQSPKKLIFLRCGNIRFNADMDVLADNVFAATHSANAYRNIEKSLRFIRSQRRHWRTRYMPPSPADLPVRRKRSNLKHLNVYVVRFFGGTLEVLAAGFRLVSRAKKKKPRPKIQRPGL
jgi:hypothetical protein